jgi:hypothetical protein
MAASAPEPIEESAMAGSAPASQSRNERNCWRSISWLACHERDGALSDEEMARFNAMAQRYAKPQDDTTVH